MYVYGTIILVFTFFLVLKGDPFVLIYKFISGSGLNNKSLKIIHNMFNAAFVIYIWCSFEIPLAYRLISWGVFIALKVSLCMIPNAVKEK